MRSREVGGCRALAAFPRGPRGPSPRPPRRDRSAGRRGCQLLRGIPVLVTRLRIWQSAENTACDPLARQRRAKVGLFPVDSAGTVLHKHGPRESLLGSGGFSWVIMLRNARIEPVGGVRG